MTNEEIDDVIFELNNKYMDIGIIAGDNGKILARAVAEEVAKQAAQKEREECMEICNDVMFLCSVGYDYAFAGALFVKNKIFWREINES